VFFLNSVLLLPVMCAGMSSSLHVLHEIMLSVGGQAKSLHVQHILL